MRTRHPFYPGTIKVTACYGLVLAFCLMGCGPKPAPPAAAPAKPKTDTAKAAGAATPTNSLDAYISVFEDLPPPKGKDPFFPNSHRRDQKVEAVAVANVPVAPTLVLKAVIRGSHHSQAVINNEILEVGEEQPVRVPNGKVKVKCLEIGKNYAVIQVEGESEPKRLTMEKKKD